MGNADSTPERAAEVLSARLNVVPDVALILGSGLRAEGLFDAPGAELGFDAVPGLPAPSVPGHTARLFWGRSGGLNVLAFGGRVHLYEGRSPAEVTFAVRTAAALGVKSLILTNAAAGLAKRHRVGDLFIIGDQMNLTGADPTALAPGESGPPVFTPVADLYDRQWRRLLRRAAHRHKLRAHTGVYAGVRGPAYETPAEVRMLVRLGADAVGMSTVLEAIAARAAGMRVAGVSVMTNRGTGQGKPPSHEEVLRVGRESGAKLLSLLRESFALASAEPSV